ncbi:hypothetical protein MWU65_14845 [Cellulophaga sp. F20128]|uniref:hypothetical protein n=1 Tax=Cellulophaga sp. F20128 TaxID=2926413 RepID=UPI001FF1A46B|nr:hypothetical protein [Cellulophaga sp. F20128]MCK0158470.1 hypothetical protein [Cellulophaga sp. F20128]
MDQESTIIGAVVAALCIIPFVFILRTKKKAENNMLNALKEIANRYSCSIATYEYSGDFIIGMDLAKNYVFFYKKTKTHEDEQVINLAEFQDCKILQSSRNNHNKSSFSEIKTLDLQFLSKQNKVDRKLEFYNAEDNLQLNGELEAIKKWSKTITEQLQKIA